MQITSSIHAPDPVQNRQDSLVWGARNSKKSKPGLFAKLLESLTGKSQNITKNRIQNGPKIEPESIEKSVGKISVKNNQISEIKALQSPKKTNSSFFKTETVEKNNDNRRLAAPRRNAMEPQTPAIQAGFYPKGDSKDDNRPVRAEEVSFTDAGKIEPKNPERNRNRAAVDVFPPRNLDSQFLEFSGKPRTALVDIMPGISNREESRENNQNPEVRGKKNRTVLEVRDLRTAENRQQTSTETVNSLKSALLNSEKPDAEIPVDLLVNRAGDDSGKSGDNNPKNMSFEDALSTKLRENLNSDIVQQASIILRNGNEGTIRLSLRPESLGNVKIRLEMTENKITGHIIVESSEAFRAFERELPVLEKAFADSGFSETSLNMFLAQGGSEQGQSWNRDFPNGIIPLITAEAAALNYDSETDRKVIANESISPDLTERIAVNMLI